MEVFQLWHPVACSSHVQLVFFHIFTLSRLPTLCPLKFKWRDLNFYNSNACVSLTFRQIGRFLTINAIPMLREQRARQLQWPYSVFALSQWHPNFLFHYPRGDIVTLKEWFSIMMYVWSFEDFSDFGIWQKRGSIKVKKNKNNTHPWLDFLLST